MPPHPKLQPYVLTLTLDPRTTKSLTSLRTRYFPSERNHLSSHLTFFHALPPSRRTDVLKDLSYLSSVVKPFGIVVGPPFKMGSAGVGIRIRAGEEDKGDDAVQALHGRLLKRWMSTGLEMTDQDKRPLNNPHVTVMNKAQKEEVERCWEQLAGKGWRDKKGEAVGLTLWEYQRDGSWVFMQDFPFGPGECCFCIP